MAVIPSLRVRRATALDRWCWHLVAIFVAGVLIACTNDGASSPAADEVPAATDLGARPQISSVLPEDRGEPPEDLTVTDLVAGDGPAVREGQVLTVHYVGADWQTGVTFDASWDRGVTFQFTVGQGQVIDGWDQGLVGMQEGGRRMLVIPPGLGYGDRGSGSLIAPGATLVFIVDLLAVEDTDPADGLSG